MIASIIGCGAGFLTTHKIPVGSITPDTVPVTSCYTTMVGAVLSVPSENIIKAHEASSNVSYRPGENPFYARRRGWPVRFPDPAPSAILPGKRIVAYYGNPLSKKMGVLGEYPKPEMLKRLQIEVERWTKADPQHPVQPALHLIVVTAQGANCSGDKYRLIMTEKLINEVYGWAKECNAILFIDIQTGIDDIRNLLPKFEWILKNPDVHLAIDPEFNLISSGAVPGSRIGTYSAADINYCSNYLRTIIAKYQLPPKVLVVHRFTPKMITDYKNIMLSSEVQIVIDMDGWGPPMLKRATYKNCIVSEPVQFTGFKLFYHNDTKGGDPLMTPEEVLKLMPKPVYIQYQ